MDSGEQNRGFRKNRPRMAKNTLPLRCELCWLEIIGKLAEVLGVEPAELLKVPPKRRRP